MARSTLGAAPPVVRLAGPTLGPCGLCIDSMPAAGIAACASCRDKNWESSHSAAWPCCPTAPPNRALQIIHRVIIQQARPQLPDDVPEELRQLAEACWQSCPDSRPSFRQVAASLEALLAGLVAPLGEEGGQAARHQGGGGEQRPGGLQAVVEEQRLPDASHFVADW
jgi:hypothetical protein